MKACRTVCRLQSPAFLFLFVADECIADLDFEIAIEDDTAFIALIDLIGILLVLLQVAHGALTDNLIAAFDLDLRSTDHLAFGDTSSDNHIALAGLEDGED